MYTLRTPYLRPGRLIAASSGRIRPPDFLIIGTERGGTTSLYQYLMRNVTMVPALRKEIHFFDQHYYKGRSWYLAHFPVRNDDVLSGEASPHYYFFPEAAPRVAETLPNAKLIMLLRNPIDRAYSHYQHEVAMGYEKLSFEGAINREFTVTDGVWKPKDLRAKGISEYVHFSYLSKGLYITYLKRWMEAVERDRFLILNSERLFNEPGKVFPQVLSFLGLPSNGLTSFGTFNEGQYEQLDEKTRARLLAFYAPYNEELSRFLDMDFEWA